MALSSCGSQPHQPRPSHTLPSLFWWHVCWQHGPVKPWSQMQLFVSFTQMPRPLHLRSLHWCGSYGNAGSPVGVFVARGAVGASVTGAAVGLTVGSAVGEAEGYHDGDSVGREVGASVGETLGSAVGLHVGIALQINK